MLWLFRVTSVGRDGRAVRVFKVGMVGRGGRAIRVTRVIVRARRIVS
jgi:hypothetical protein